MIKITVVSLWRRRRRYSKCIASYYIFFRMVLYELTCFFCRFSLLFDLGVMRLMMTRRWSMMIGTLSISKRLGILPFITLVTRLVPWMNPYMLTTLVDWWRPETHSFNLGCGEMTIDLQSPWCVDMILALPIKGQPLCFSRPKMWVYEVTHWVCVGLTWHGRTCTYRGRVEV
jgi:hypothetical protein